MMVEFENIVLFLDDIGYGLFSDGTENESVDIETAGLQIEMPGCFYVWSADQSVGGIAHPRVIVLLVIRHEIVHVYDGESFLRICLAVGTETAGPSERSQRAVVVAGKIIQFSFYIHRFF